MRSIDEMRSAACRRGGRNRSIIPDAGVRAAWPLTLRAQIVRPDGTRRLYRTEEAALASLAQFMTDFWRDRLLRLKLAAEAAEWQSIEGRGRE